MQTKSAQIATLLEAGKFDKALAMAGRFFDNGADTQLFKQARSALLSPALYRGMGHDPEEIVGRAVARLKKRFLEGDKRR